MGNTTLADLIPLILSSGAGMFILAVFQGWRDARQGARQGQRETVEDLVRWRDELAHRYDAALAELDFYRDVAARRAYQLRQAGMVPAGHDEAPPSARRTGGS